MSDAVIHTLCQSRAAAVQAWTSSQVSDWLATSELTVFAPLLASHGIEGADLVDLCQEDLVSIGVARLHDRKRILRAVAALLGE